MPVSEIPNKTMQPRGRKFKVKRIPSATIPVNTDPFLDAVTITGPAVLYQAVFKISAATTRLASVPSSTPGPVSGSVAGKRLGRAVAPVRSLFDAVGVQHGQQMLADQVCCLCLLGRAVYRSPDLFRQLACCPKVRVHLRGRRGPRPGSSVRRIADRRGAGERVEQWQRFCGHHGHPTSNQFHHYSTTVCLYNSLLGCRAEREAAILGIDPDRGVWMVVSSQ